MSLIFFIPITKLTNQKKGICRHLILYPLRLRPPFPNDAKILKPKVGLWPDQITNWLGSVKIENITYYEQTNLFLEDKRPSKPSVCVRKFEYVTAYEVAKEVVWLKKFLSDLGVVRMEQFSITLFCDNSGAVAQSKDPRNHKKWKHIKRKYHIIRDIVIQGDVVVAKIDSANNLADPFTKVLPQRTFESHLEGMGVRLVHNSL